MSFDDARRADADINADRNQPKNRKRSRLWIWGVGLVVLAASAYLAAPLLGYRILRFNVAGMTPTWGITGPHELRPGSENVVKFFGPTWVPSLIRMLDDNDPLVANGAQVALTFFPERADISVPALLNKFAKAQERVACQGLAACIEKLLPANAKTPPEIADTLNDGNPYRQMIGFTFVLKSEPRNEAARAALVQALDRVRNPNERPGGFDQDGQLVPAYHAVEALKLMPAGERGFAEEQILRILQLSNEDIGGFSEIVRFRDFLRSWRDGKV